MLGADSHVSDRFGPTVAGFLEAAHQVPPHLLSELIAESCAHLGADNTRVWLADHQQRFLCHLTVGEPRDALAIDATVAGRAFINSELVQWDGAGDRIHLWVPLIDGVDRIGVLEIEASAVPGDGLDVFCDFASVATAELITRGQYTDLLTQTRRIKPMSLAAELQWQSLPPNTFSTDDVAIAGMMEPAYDVGGDCFDYAHAKDRLSFAILDAVGHDLHASVVSALALGAYRNSRRGDADLDAIADCMDETIKRQIGRGAFVTGQLAALDTVSGTLHWLNAGHPSPLLVRHGKVIGSLSGQSRVPFGLRHLDPGHQGSVAVQQLEPGDGVFLYSDGVVEAKGSDGEDFGLERLEDFLQAAIASGLSPAETLRRLSNAVLDFNGGVLQDDATTVLVVWQPEK